MPEKDRVSPISLTRTDTVTAAEPSAGVSEEQVTADSSRLADPEKPTTTAVTQPATNMLRFNTRLKHADRDYLIQTVVDPAAERLRSDIFNEGIRLTSIIGEALPDLPSERILPTLRQLHERVSGEIARIFRLSQAATDAHEASLHNYIGELFASRHMWLDARREFERAVLLNSDYSEARYNLGSCYLQLHLYQEAEEHLDCAVRLRPRYPDYLNRLGEVYLELSSCRKAVDFFRKATQQNPYYWEPYCNTGLAHILNGVRRENYQMHVDLKRRAREMFEKAAVIEPALKSSDYFMGQRYLDEDRLSESFDAYTAAKDAVKATPRPIPISALDLALCSEQFMPTEAELSSEINRLREEVRLHPHYADLHYRLAQSYTILAQLVHRRSIQEYDRALAINPDFHAAQRNRRLAENEDRGMSLLVKATLRSTQQSKQPLSQSTDPDNQQDTDELSGDGSTE